MVEILDHVGGCKNFAKDIKKNNGLVIGHKDTALGIAVQGNKIPEPNIIFKKEYDLNFGNQKLELRFFGDIHSVSLLISFFFPFFP